MALKIKVFWGVTLCRPAFPKNEVPSSRTGFQEHLHSVETSGNINPPTQRHIPEGPIRQQIIIIIIIIGSTALGGPWSPRANVGSDLYSGHPPVNLYNPVSLRLLLPPQSFLISVGHVLVFVKK